MKVTRRNQLRMGKCPRCDGEVSRCEGVLRNPSGETAPRFVLAYCCNFCEWVEEVQTR